MRKLQILICLCFLTTSANAVIIIDGSEDIYQINGSNQNNTYKSNCDWNPKRIKVNIPDLPKNINLNPNGKGGYNWIDSGNPNSDNILDRLPQGHSITPNGNGGYNIN